MKGFLQEVHFKEGANVKKGDLLLVIEEEPFKVKVAQAKAALEEAEAAIKKAKESKAREVAKAKVSLDNTQLQLDRDGRAAGAEPGGAKGRLPGRL